MSPDDMNKIISESPSPQNDSAYKELMSEVREIKQNGVENIGYERAVRVYESLLIRGDKTIGIAENILGENFIKNAAPKIENKLTAEKVANSLKLQSMGKLFT